MVRGYKGHNHIQEAGFSGCSSSADEDVHFILYCNPNKCEHARAACFVSDEVCNSPRVSGKLSDSDGVSFGGYREQDSVRSVSGDEVCVKQRVECSDLSSDAACDDVSIVENLFFVCKLDIRFKPSMFFMIDTNGFSGRGDDNFFKVFIAHEVLNISKAEHFLHKHIHKECNSF